MMDPKDPKDPKDPNDRHDWVRAIHLTHFMYICERCGLKCESLDRHHPPGKDSIIWTNGEFMSKILSCNEYICSRILDA